MNSLSYLSRQFDVLASPKSTANSTPVQEPSRLISDEFDSDGQDDVFNNGEPALKRVNTWSSRRSFLSSRTQEKRSHTQDASTSPFPKRSNSSPAELDNFPTSTPSKPRRRTSIVITSLDSGTSVLVHTKPRSSQGPLFRLRRVFLVRILAVVWDALCSCWARIRRDMTRARHDASMEDGDSSDDPGSESKSAILLVTESEKSLQAPPDAPPPPYTPTEVKKPAKKTPFHLPKTLVLDLDETLIHSTSRHLNYSSSRGGFLGLRSLFGSRSRHPEHTVEVHLGGRSTMYHVYKRPHVDYFLRKVSGWYTLVIFTASLQEYADPVIDWLDGGSGILEHRFFRDSCTKLPDGSFSKDLSQIEPDLSRVCILDNSPISYRMNEANGIPIEGWTHDPFDEALLDLLPVLDSLRFTGDVRRVLGIRGFS